MAMALALAVTPFVSIVACHLSLARRWELD